MFEALGMVGTVQLEGNAERTHMRVTIRGTSLEQLEQLVALGIAANTDRTLDNLARHIAQRA